MQPFFAFQLPRYLLVLVAVAVLAACGDDEDGNDNNNNQGPGVPQKEGRKFSIVVYPAADEDWWAAANRVADEKCDFVTFTFSWREAETAPGVYNTSSFSGVQGVAAYRNTPIAWVLGADRPQDLQHLAWDDTLVLSRLRRMLDTAKAYMPTLRLEMLVLGTDVDGFLNTPAEYAAFRSLLAAARAKAEALWGANTVVASSVSYWAAMNPAEQSDIQNLMAAADVNAFSFYPLNPDWTAASPSTQQSMFNLLVDAYNNKPIYILGTAFPTDTANQASPALQADYVNTLFGQWDTHRARVPVVVYTLLHDPNPADVDSLIARAHLAHDVNLARVRGFFTSLGLRTRPAAGTDKPAFATMRAALQARGW